MHQAVLDISNFDQMLKQDLLKHRPESSGISVNKPFYRNLHDLYQFHPRKISTSLLASCYWPQRCSYPFVTLLFNGHPSLLDHAIRYQHAYALDVLRSDSPLPTKVDGKGKAQSIRVSNQLHADAGVEEASLVWFISLGHAQCGVQSRAPSLARAGRICYIGVVVCIAVLLFYFSLNTHTFCTYIIDYPIQPHSLSIYSLFDSRNGRH